MRALDIYETGVASATEVLYRGGSGGWISAPVARVELPSAAEAYGAGVVHTARYRWMCMSPYGDDLFTEDTKMRIAGCSKYTLAVRGDGELALARLDRIAPYQREGVAWLAQSFIRALFLPLPFEPLSAPLVRRCRELVGLKRGYYLHFAPHCQEDVRTIDRTARAKVRRMLRVTLLFPRRALLVGPEADQRWRLTPVGSP